jgi:hypothetical protein
MDWQPRCVERRGTPCNDCVECLATIPNGGTCAGCAHIYRCKAFGYTDSPENRYCGFLPSRYAPKAVPRA